MSYAMTHWIVANEIAKNKSIYNKGLFLLGAIAPDGVHERKNYEKWMKQKSHFLPEGLEWGLTTELDQINSWYESLGKVYKEKSLIIQDMDALSFLQGIAAHILVDQLNTRTVYVPALKNFGIEVLQLGSEYRVQCVSVDLQLFQLYDESKEMLEEMEIALETLSNTDILQQLELSDFPSADEIGSFLHGVRNIYENDKPQKTREDYNSVSITEKFLKLSIGSCEKLLFDFPQPGNIFELEL